MSEEPKQDILKIITGAGIIFFSSLLSLLLSFISRIIIARSGTEDYGVFSLTLAVLNICVVISTLGLQSGVSRNIAYFRGKGDTDRVEEIASTSIHLALLASVLVSFTLFIASDYIAQDVFHTSKLAFPLKIISIGIPFLTLITVISSIFLGFGRAEAIAYFQRIMINILFILFLLVVLLFRLPFISIFYSYLLSIILSFLGIIVYMVRKLPLHIHFGKRLTPINSVQKDLLFSLPLLGVSILEMVIMWIDTFMIGYLKSMDLVGIYNAGLLLARFITMPLGVVIMIYLPTISEIFSQGSMLKIKRNYIIVTKWLCLSTFPLFLIQLLFPDSVLNLIFGANYVPATNALRILSIGFMIVNFFGPNSSTLVALGETKFIMKAMIVAVIINVTLNTILIPFLGIDGAAIASTITLSFLSIVYSIKLYLQAKVCPISTNLIRSIIISFGLILLFYFVLKNLVTITLLTLILHLIGYYTIIGLVILFTKSFDREDLIMLQEIGINIKLLIKKIINKLL